MANILIAEDERAINDLIKLNLSLVGHKCEQVFDGAAALERALSGEHDLVILDVMLPELSGFEIIGQIKTPVIFVTARVSVEDRLRGLKLGADDYIVKPFEILELVERVKAVLRRTKGESEAFEFDGIRVEFDTRRVYKDGAEVILKPKEFELLSAFITNRNLALSREKLIELVWDFDYEGDTRTVDVHVQKLRQKLGISERLKTVYKTGYRLEI
ncbi:MAG: response regulator transcription factor [Clostridia bacterium]|nr:response regulator transcription factor [Clostridia bacterium]MBR6578793.1 response regulator transcription factor [Clostridia bacterium]